MKVKDRIIERAAAQHGYVTTHDAREMGIDPAQLRQLAARGGLERTARGVYRVPVLPRSPHDELAEAIAWTLGRGVLSHETALLLHGISDVNPPRIHLTVPANNPVRAAGGELYRVYRRNLDPAEITEKENLPVTNVTRTIIDCLAAGTDPRQLELAVGEAEAEGDLKRNEAARLRTALEHPQRGRARRQRDIAL